MKSSGWLHRLLKVTTVLILIALPFVPLAQQPVTGQAQLLAATTKIFLPSVYQLPRPTGSVPLPSTSYYYYMRNYTIEKARALGCETGARDANLAGAQDSLVILDFGITKYQNGQYGASGMRIGGFYTMSQIAEAVQQFGLGYWNCTAADYASHVQIGIGTNNYNDSNVYSNLSVTYNHGQAWAQMVNAVNVWFQNACPNGCNGQVDAVGANDIELAWSEPEDAINWINGYDSANLYPLVNFGAAEGCPYSCGGGGHYWTRDEVLRVTNEGPVYAMPEIYLNDGRNAQQWYQLSAYSASKLGYPFDFIGVMTTYGACLQEPDDESCPYIDNTPEEGWTQLNSLVNGSNSATWDTIPYVTDIQWLAWTAD